MKRRQKWDHRFLEIAKKIAQWSKDSHRKIGAVIVKDGRIIAQGYNGIPRNIPDTLIKSPEKNRYVVHAEANALINATCDVRGATIYITGLPVCQECAKLIIQSGIKRVVYDTSLSRASKWFNSNTVALAMFKMAKIEVCKVHNRQIVMIHGNHGSGKNYVAEQLKKKYNCTLMSFADPVKACVAKMFDVDLDFIEKNKNSDAIFSRGLTLRQFLQKFATDAMQTVAGRTIWKDILMQSLPESGLIVVTDWRFKHEFIPNALKVHVLGGTPDNHVSERDLDDCVFDVVIDNTNHKHEPNLDKLFDAIDKGA